MSDIGRSDYELAPANSIAEVRLIDFARVVWPDRRPDVRIRATWWRRAGPEYAIVAVHRATGAVAGVLAAWPCQWTIKGQAVPAIAYSDWFVAPAHAGRGLGKMLARHFDAPDRFVYALSLSDPAVSNLRKLGWRGPYPSALMVLPLPRLARLLPRAAVRDIAFEPHEFGSGESLGALAPDLDAIEAAHGPAIPARARRAAQDWVWRLSVCGPRRYHFCLARQGGRDGKPVGYVAVRRMLPGVRPLMDRLNAAIITDMVACNDEPSVLNALAQKAVEMAAALRASLLFTATTNAAHQRALAQFLSPETPLLGGFLARRAPQFMWLGDGPGAALEAPSMSLTFADGATDLDL